MKKRTKFIIAIITGLTLTAGLAACSWHSKTPSEKADYMVEKITKKLDLNAEQVTELEKLKSELLTAREDFLSEKQGTHSAINELLMQPTLDQQRLLELVQGHTASMNQKAPMVISSVAGFYDSLTPEQQATIREKIAHHHERYGHWHHRSH